MRYVIALGSNRRGRHGAPVREVAAAIVALELLGKVRAASPILATAPLGPSIRRFANAAVLIETSEPPAAVLRRLKSIEQAFGRRRGQRWGARVIDLDIVLWSGGRYRDATLIVPHIAFRTRRFVLDCLLHIVPDWRDPVTGRTIRQLTYRARAVDRGRARP